MTREVYKSVAGMAPPDASKKFKVAAIGALGRRRGPHLYVSLDLRRERLRAGTCTDQDTRAFYQVRLEMKLVLQRRAHSIGNNPPSTQKTKCPRRVSRSARARRGRESTGPPGMAATEQPNRLRLVNPHHRRSHPSS